MTEQGQRTDGDRGLSRAESQAALEAVVEAETDDAAGGAALLGEGEDSGDVGVTAADTEAAGAGAAAGAARATPRRKATRGTPAGAAETQPADVVAGETVRVVQGGAQSIQAGSVTVQQGGAQQIRGDRVDIRQGGAGRVEGGEVSVRQGAIGIAQGERIHLEMGAIVAALGTNVEVHQGFTRFVGARESVRLEQAGAMTVLANRVDMSPQSGAVFLLAREVHGDVRSVFDWRASAAFGAAFAVVLTLLRSLRGRR